MPASAMGEDGAAVSDGLAAGADVGALGGGADAAGGPELAPGPVATPAQAAIQTAATTGRPTRPLSRAATKSVIAASDMAKIGPCPEFAKPGTKNQFRIEDAPLFFTRSGARASPSGSSTVDVVS